MKDYRITIKSTIDGETNEVITLGSVLREYGFTTVRYEDADSSDPTKIVIGDGIISIAREGELNSVLTFEKDKVYSANLVTAFGEIPVEVKTLDVSAEETGGNVDMKLDYITDFGGKSSRFNISLKAEKLDLYPRV
ncbi:MAG: DUF1934 domain-containing protein [Clostridia bacterium]|nr:DUF1934 domain-containing protein [Clostridia bacterium]